MLRVEGRLEHGTEAIVVRLGDRIVAMVVALAQATVRPSTAEPTILIVSVTTWFDARASAAPVAVPSGAVRRKPVAARSCVCSGVRFAQGFGTSSSPASCLDEEPVERLVGVQGLDDVIAVFVGELSRRVLGAISFGVGIARRVEPVPRPTLAVVRAGQEVGRRSRS